MKKSLVAALSVCVLMPLAASAEEPKAFKDGREVVEAFYSDILNNKDDATLRERAALIVAQNWDDEPGPQPGVEGLDGLVNIFTKYHQAIPDMNWEPQEVLKAGNNRYVVRSIGSGTPVFDFLGVGIAPEKSRKKVIFHPIDRYPYR